MTNERARATEQLLRAAHLLYARGLATAYEGNLSARVGDSLLITPSQLCKGDVRECDLVEVRIADGTALPNGAGRRASSETKLHLCAYRARPDIGGVAHAHTPYATVHAVRNVPIESRAYPEMIVLYGSVPVCRYGTPGSEAVCDEVPGALARGDQLLLAQHGLVTVGSDIMEAFYRLESVEGCARVLLLARAMGGENPLPDAEVAKLLAMGEAMRAGR